MTEPTYFMGPVSHPTQKTLFNNPSNPPPPTKIKPYISNLIINILKERKKNTKNTVNEFFK